MAGDPAFAITENASLEQRNTFRVAARARRLIECRDVTSLGELFESAIARAEPLLVLGSGSNILFTRDWPGTVLSIATRGITVIDDTDGHVLVRVEAGENWHEFVRWSLQYGVAGLENLALIPGTVGAAPIQNIGAYGVEVREFVHAVEAFDLDTHAMLRFDNRDCAFAYRDSRFKREPGRHVVTAVEFRIPRTRRPRVDYTGVREELASMGVTEPTSQSVFEAIVRLRLRKLPNPAVIGNAGSFFKNPVASADHVQALMKRTPNLPVWLLPDGSSKLSAAWLIEACHFKGVRDHDAAVSSQHALVLVNHGHATGAEILALARRIQTAVRERFDVALEPEPIVV